MKSLGVYAFFFYDEKDSKFIWWGENNRKRKVTGRKEGITDEARWLGSKRRSNPKEMVET